MGLVSAILDSTGIDRRPQELSKPEGHLQKGGMGRKGEKMKIGKRKKNGRRGGEMNEKIRKREMKGKKRSEHFLNACSVPAVRHNGKCSEATWR